MTTETLGTDDLPPLFREADESSERAQRAHVVFNRANLLALVGAAALFAVPSTDPGRATMVHGIATLLLAGSALLSAVAARRSDRRVWYESRAVAESVKSLAWKYVCGSEPFDRSDEDTEESFVAALHDVLEQARAVPALMTASADASQLTQKMRRLRDAPVEQRFRLYLADRIEDQQGWYSRRSRQHGSAGGRLGALSVVFQGLALAAAVLLLILPTAGLNAVGALSAAAAAFIAWNELMRHDELASAYALASRELSAIASRAERLPREDGELARFVADAETAISREHTLWIARRTVAGGGPTELTSAL